MTADEISPTLGAQAEVECLSFQMRQKSYNPFGSTNAQAAEITNKTTRKKQVELDGMYSANALKDHGI